MSAGRDRWIEAGRPKHGIARPIADLKAVLNRYGYVVGTVGDDRHMMARTPEDHTWYSATGWPSAAVLGWIYADDIMAPPRGAGLPSLAELGGQMSRDRSAGVPGMEWLKYQNWEPGDGRCIHEAWDPNHRVTDSSDRGHIHQSCRTDYRTSDTVSRNGYDPVARCRGGIVVPVSTPPSTGYPAYGGRVLVRRSPMMHGQDVLGAQARLKARGWRITVDGWYGPQSADVVRRFQVDSTRHGWSLTQDGKWGPNTHRAAWLRPVT